MAEAIMGKLEYLENRVEEFRKEIESEFQVITPRLSGVLRELQEKLPEEITSREMSTILFFRDCGLACVLTKNEIIDKSKMPYGSKTAESLVNRYVNPSKKWDPEAHHPSIFWTQILLKRFKQIAEYYKIELDGEYLKK